MRTRTQRQFITDIVEAMSLAEQFVAGMRDVLVHGYWAVQLEVVWESIHQDFPATRPLLEQVLKDLPSKEST